MRELFRNYRRLLSRPRGVTLLIAAAGARLPQGMVGLALLLMVAHYYGVERGGAAVACYSVGLGLLAPLRGRLADRRGLTWTLRMTGVIYVAAIVLLVALCSLRTAVLLVMAASAVVGLAAPPLGPGVRGIWASIPDRGERRAGLAVDASFVDASFILGPLVVSGLQYLWPGAAMLASLAVTVAGAACLMSVSRALGATAPQAASGPSALPVSRFGDLVGPLRVPAFRRLLVVVVLVNGAVTGTMVVLPSLAHLSGASWATGLLVAGVSIGSVIGALLWARSNPSTRSGNQLAGLTACFAITLAILPLAGDHHIWVLLCVAPLAGLPIASTMATMAARAHELSPVGATEAQSWVVTFNQLGASASAAAVSTVAQFGDKRLALCIPSILAALAAASSFAFSGHLSRRRGRGLDGGQVKRAKSSRWEGAGSGDPQTHPGREHSKT